jgi:CheY-like chemotaxis protein
MPVSRQDLMNDYIRVIQAHQCERYQDGNMVLNNKPLALIIDDENDVRAILHVALEYKGWEVDEAGNGRDGLCKVRETRPQLILVDLMMPEMTGIEFFSRLTDDEALRSIPVLLMSAVNERARLLDPFWQLPLTTKSFLKKPFGTKELMELIERMVPAPNPSARKQKPVRKNISVHSPGDEAMEGPRIPALPPWLQKKEKAVEPDPAWGEPPAHADKIIPQQPADPGPPSRQPDRHPLVKPAEHVRPGVTATGTPMSNEPHRRGFRILIIDDDQDILDVMSERLSQYHVVATANNGMIALKDLEDFVPDFVISDVNMPVMNGLQTAQAIRQHPHLSGIPIFFMTGENDENLSRKSFDVGGNLYLRKPIDPNSLLNYIDFFLEESGLQPAGDQSRQMVQTPDTSVPHRLRLLIIDYNIENQKILKQLLGEHGSRSHVQGGPFEVLSSLDPRVAIGRLIRWEPDIIFYNPKNPGMNGVEFQRIMKLQCESGGIQSLVYAGNRLTEKDLTEYREKFGLEGIDLTISEDEMIGRLNEVIRAMGRTPGKKQYPIELILEEETGRKSSTNSNISKARERDILRQRFQSIQKFIDRQYAA